MEFEPLSEGFWLLAAIVFLILFIFVLFTYIICWLLRSPRDGSDAPRQCNEIKNHGSGDHQIC
jgi:Na+-transporting methylmalonyl-CoA/oxaloacetate decarboxylase gamma subunit